MIWFDLFYYRNSYNSWIFLLSLMKLLPDEVPNKPHAQIWHILIRNLDPLQVVEVKGLVGEGGVCV